MTPESQQIAIPPAAGTAISTPVANAEARAEKCTPKKTSRNTTTSRRGAGKIAHLPNATRDQLNLMLRDGIKYKEIIAKLGDDAKGLVPRNLSTWLKSPNYQLWLMEQDWREDLRVHQQSAIGLADDFDSARFNQGALQLAITRLFQALRHLDSGDLNQQLGGSAQSFARLVTALARACRETTNIEKFRQAVEALAAKARQGKPEGSSNPLEDIVREWNKVFGHRNPAPFPPYPNGNANNTTGNDNTSRSDAVTPVGQNANGNNTTSNNNPAPPAPSPSPLS